MPDSYSWIYWFFDSYPWKFIAFEIHCYDQCFFFSRDTPKCPWHTFFGILSRALLNFHGHFFENCHGLDQKCHGHFFGNCHGQIWNVTGILKKTCHGHFTVCHGHFFVLISFFFYLELSHHRWYLESHLSQVYYFQLKKHVIKPQFPEQKSLLL